MLENRNIRKTNEGEMQIYKAFLTLADKAVKNGAKVYLSDNDYIMIDDLKRWQFAFCVERFSNMAGKLLQKMYDLQIPEIQLIRENFDRREDAGEPNDTTAIVNTMSLDEFEKMLHGINHYSSFGIDLCEEWLEQLKKAAIHNIDFDKMKEMMEDNDNDELF